MTDESIVWAAMNPREIDPTLDDGKTLFVMNFIANVAAVVGHRDDREHVIRSAKHFLLLALQRDRAAGDSAWATLHHAIAQLVTEAGATRSSSPACAYLQTFLDDTSDLLPHPRR